MTAQVFILRSAKTDLQDLKYYLSKKFGKVAWNESYANIKEALATIEKTPESGRRADELIELHLMQYRQILSGKNRISYELRENTIFVHIICDTRQDLRNLLMRRLVRAS